MFSKMFPEGKQISVHQRVIKKTEKKFRKFSIILGKNVLFRVNFSKFQEINEQYDHKRQEKFSFKEF